MSRCNTIAAAALAALALAAPAASAQPADLPAPPLAAAVAAKQDLRSPDARDAARAVPSTREAALAQERYYASYGEPAPPVHVARTVAADTGDGIAPVPFLSAVVAALIVGLGAGGALHVLHVRRGYRTPPVA